MWSYAAYGTSAWPQDACTYDAIQAGAGQYGLRDVLTAIIHAPHFSQRFSLASSVIIGRVRLQADGF